MTNTEDIIRRHLLTTILAGEAPEHLRAGTPLVSSGIVDSLGLMTLVAFLEHEFDVELGADDTAVERFDSIAQMAAAVDARRAPAVPGSRQTA